MRRKRYGLVLLVLLLCVTGIACKKKEDYVARTVQDVCSVYAYENALAYTIDEEGNLYCFDRYDTEDGSQSMLQLVKVDKDGNELFRRTTEQIKNSGLTAIAVKDKLLYYTGHEFDIEKKDACIALYSYHLDTEEITYIQSFRAFKRVDRMLVTEKRVYLIGKDRYGPGSADSVSYSHQGEKLMWCSLDTKEVNMMAFEEPMDMALDADGTPVFYIHTEDGFCLLRYNEAEDTAQVLAKTENYRMRYFTLCNQGESIVYATSGIRGLVLSDISDWETESELYANGNFFDAVCGANGWIACRAYTGKSIVYFPVEQVQKKTDTLRYLSVTYGTATPHGCGYKIEREYFSQQELDKFALKILAQDKDFDLCLVDSSHSISYNIKQNASFYPLNDIPGIEEYLDACFPYVREAATDEDGLIWMLPVAVNIPGLVVNADIAGEYGFSNNMSFVEFLSGLTALSEEELMRLDTPEYAFIREFFRQYFAKYKSVDTEVFRENLSLFSKTWEQLEKPDASSSDGGEDVYEYVLTEETYHFQFVLDFCENKAVVSVPKLNAEDKNYGTCLFLAVNPESDRLEATLQYLADWIAYTMKQPEKPLFFVNREVGADAYEASLYELYQNGEIVFSIDSEIYEGYDAVLSDVSKLEEYIAETERKLRIYMGE